MFRLMRLLRRAHYWLHHRRHAADLDEEMAFHRSMTSGPAFGNATLAREDARGIWIGTWIESVRQDVVYAQRSLRRQPGFTLAALMILGAAIGLNVSLFTVFNALMRRPWPVADAPRVMSVFDPQMRNAFSLSELDDFARNSRTFDGLIATRCIDGGSDGCQVGLDDRPINADFVTANYFRVLGIGLARGAGFPAGPELLGGREPIAVISHAAWVRLFGRDEQIIGRRIRLDDVPFTIVGVAPPRFSGVSVEQKDVWIPIGAMPLLRPDYVFSDTTRGAAIAGRLASGVSREQARAELEVLSHRYRLKQSLEPAGVRVEPTTVFPNPGRRRMAYSFFALMLTAVVLVLALACANIGNLLLARAMARRREIAVRVSLGAARSRIIRQLLTESLVLASGGAALGVLIASVLPSWLMTRLIGPTALSLSPDASALAYAAGSGVLACVFFGLAPAVHGTHPDLATTMKPGAPLLLWRLPLRAVLLTVQVVVSVVLLVDATLITRGLQHVAGTDTGFVDEEVSVVTFDLPASNDMARRRRFARQLLLRGEAVVSPAPAAFTDTVPFARAGREWTTVAVPGASAQLDEDVLVREVSPRFFEVLQIPLVAGRTLTALDIARGGVLVNDSMAKRFWPGETALGRTFISHGTRQVVGIVKDARLDAGSVTQVRPMMYEPIDGRTVPQLLVKRPDAASIAAIRSLAVGLEPRARVQVAPLGDNLKRLLDEPRTNASIANALGLLALLLAAFGLFSSFAYSVQQRTAELGIRMALGARPVQVIGTMVGTSVPALLVGLTIGLAAAAVSGRVIRVFLFGLSPFDFLSYAAAVAILIVAGLAATVLPARRATRIDPLVALRHE